MPAQIGICSYSYSSAKDSGYRQTVEGGLGPRSAGKNLILQAAAVSGIGHAPDLCSQHAIASEARSRVN
jgi:hypothetical protein